MPSPSPGRLNSLQAAQRDPEIRDQEIPQLEGEGVSGRGVDGVGQVSLGVFGRGYRVRCPPFRLFTVLFPPPPFFFLPFLARLPRLASPDDVWRVWSFVNGVRVRVVGSRFQSKSPLQVVSRSHSLVCRLWGMLAGLSLPLSLCLPRVWRRLLFPRPNDHRGGALAVLSVLPGLLLANKKRVQARKPCLR